MMIKHTKCNYTVAGDKWPVFVTVLLLVLIQLFICCNSTVLKYEYTYIWSLTACGKMLHVTCHIHSCPLDNTEV